MSQSTDTRPARSPADAAVDAYLAPVAGHLSAMTAFRAGARLLVHHPEFATLDHVKWTPAANGCVHINIGLLHPDGCSLVEQLAAALGLRMTAWHSVSAKHGAVVTLKVGGFFDGADWDVWAMVPAAVFAEFQPSTDAA